ncbi:MAG: EAL domain-containing protein [Candidatus Aureabacteria bacterium]|nr:EAL domain-containing protein [Candidatus Auribacterota bacterium]
MPYVKSPILLISDDRSELISMLESFSNEEDYSLIKTSSVSKALILLSKQDCFLIILDFPSKAIFPVYTELQRHLKKSIPVFLVTEEWHDKWFVKFHGFVDCLLKPVVSEILRSKIRFLLEIQKNTERLTEGGQQWEEVLGWIQEGFWEWNFNQEVMLLSDLCLQIMDHSGQGNHCSFQEWLDWFHPDERIALERLMHTHRYQYAQSCFQVQVRILTKSGEYKWIQLRGETIFSQDNSPCRMTGSILDITGKKQGEEPLIQMGHLDSLTRLPNRYLFYDRLKQSMARSKRYNEMIAILLLDLDGFKNINDTMGHHFGDLLLQHVAEKLRGCIRETDTLARMGGDEFIFILTDIKKVQHATLVAKKILYELSKGFFLGEREWFIGASMGVSLYPMDGENMETLVKHADIAMYRAKNQGKNSYQLYTPEINTRTFEQLAMENSLRKALDHGEFTLYYQPRINLVAGLISGVEALIRWKHPDLGIVSPDSFIPLAEETGLIIPIGNWVLQTACSQHKVWMGKGCPPLRMAVNLSPVQFQNKDFPEKVNQIIRVSGMDSSFLEMEITEHMAMFNVEVTSPILNQLNKIGIRFVIDDFGTGYSSLSYLKRFPFHTLKIDRSFIRDITEKKDVLAIVKAIFSLASSLNLDVIAEGIETVEQLNCLKAIGCKEVQGYLFCTPLNAEDIFPLLMKGKFKIPC